MGFAVARAAGPPPRRKASQLLPGAANKVFATIYVECRLCPARSVQPHASFMRSIVHPNRKRKRCFASESHLAASFLSPIPHASLGSPIRLSIYCYRLVTDSPLQQPIYASVRPFLLATHPCVHPAIIPPQRRRLLPSACQRLVFPCCLRRPLEFLPRPARLSIHRSTCHPIPPPCSLPFFLSSTHLACRFCCPIGHELGASLFWFVHSRERVA